ncbi:hypothetical protein LL969_09465 [Xanthomonas campestris pv. phormiicola]|nr:hypothetical protein [Xanthomonas campestris pv. phormiicola]
MSIDRLSCFSMASFSTSYVVLGFPLLETGAEGTGLRQREQQLSRPCGRESLFFAWAKKALQQPQADQSNQKTAQPAVCPRDARVRAGTRHFSQAHRCACEKRRAACAPPFGFLPRARATPKGSGKAEARSNSQGNTVTGMTVPKAASSTNGGRRHAR